MLERLSILHISAVQRLTGASILSTFNTDTPESSFGQLGKIEHVVLNDKRSVEILVICSSHTALKRKQTSSHQACHLIIVVKLPCLPQELNWGAYSLQVQPCSLGPRPNVELLLYVIFVFLLFQLH